MFDKMDVRSDAESGAKTQQMEIELAPLHDGKSQSRGLSASTVPAAAAAAAAAAATAPADCLPEIQPQPPLDHHRQASATEPPPLSPSSHQQLQQQLSSHWQQTYRHHSPSRAKPSFASWAAFSSPSSPSSCASPPSEATDWHHRAQRRRRRRAGSRMDEQDRLWKFSTPHWLSSARVRNAGVYASGALFSLAFYVLLDAAVWSKSALNGSDVHITFIDWLPLIFSSLGMLIINSIEKSRLSGDSFSYSGSGVAWQARVVLFLGFAALAGGMAGGVTVFVMKFVVAGVPWPMMSMGVENVVANALVGLSTAVLWVSQNMEDEYTYNLRL